MSGDAQAKRRKGKGKRKGGNKVKDERLEDQLFMNFNDEDQAADDTGQSRSDDTNRIDGVKADLSRSKNTSHRNPENKSTGSSCFTKVVFLFLISSLAVILALIVIELQRNPSAGFQSFGIINEFGTVEETSKRHISPDKSDSMAKEDIVRHAADEEPHPKEDHQLPVDSGDPVEETPPLDSVRDTSRRKMVSAPPSPVDDHHYEERTQTLPEEEELKKNQGKTPEMVVAAGKDKDTEKYSKAASGPDVETVAKEPPVASEKKAPAPGESKESHKTGEKTLHKEHGKAESLPTPSKKDDVSNKDEMLQGSPAVQSPVVEDPDVVLSQEEVNKPLNSMEDVEEVDEKIRSKKPGKTKEKVGSDSESTDKKDKRKEKEKKDANLKKEDFKSLQELYLQVEALAEEVLELDPKNSMVEQLTPHLGDVLQSMEAGKHEGLKETLQHIQLILADVHSRLKEHTLPESISEISGMAGSSDDARGKRDIKDIVDAIEEQVITDGAKLMPPSPRDALSGGDVVASVDSSVKEDMEGRVPVDEVVPDPVYIKPLGDGDAVVDDNSKSQARRKERDDRKHMDVEQKEELKQRHGKTDEVRVAKQREGETVSVKPERVKQDTWKEEDKVATSHEGASMEPGAQSDRSKPMDSSQKKHGNYEGSKLQSQVDKAHLQKEQSPDSPKEKLENTLQEKNKIPTVTLPTPQEDRKRSQKLSKESMPVSEKSSKSISGTDEKLKSTGALAESPDVARKSPEVVEKSIPIKKSSQPRKAKTAELDKTAPSAEETSKPELGVNSKHKETMPENVQQEGSEVHLKEDRDDLSKIQAEITKDSALKSPEREGTGTLTPSSEAQDPKQTSASSESPEPQKTPQDEPQKTAESAGGFASRIEKKYLKELEVAEDLVEKMMRTKQQMTQGRVGQMIQTESMA